MSTVGEALDVQVFVRDEQRRHIGETTLWSSLTLVQRRNDVGQWTLTTSDPDEAEMLTPRPGAGPNRGVIIRRNGQTIASGWCDSRKPDYEVSGGEKTWTFGGYDDTFLMARATVWPKPDAPIGAQTDAYDIKQGPASNRIRDYFIDNVQERMGIAEAVGGDQLNLGPNRKTRARFNPKLLALAQAIAKRDLNFQVRQRYDRNLFLYQWLPVDKRDSVVFSPAVGTVQSYSITSTETTANVVIIGAGGEGEARGFYRRQDDADVLANGPIEEFKDRRDLSLLDDEGQPSGWEEEAEADALEFLAENVGRHSLRVALTGSEDMRYGIDFIVGDLTRYYLDQDENQQPIGLVDDLVDEAATTWNDQGERCEVRVGAALDESDTTTLLAKDARETKRRLGALEARR